MRLRNKRTLGDAKSLRRSCESAVLNHFTPHVNDVKKSNGRLKERTLAIKEIYHYSMLRLADSFIAKIHLSGSIAIFPLLSGFGIRLVHSAGM